MAWNIDASINHLIAQGRESPNKECGLYVRMAINAGGLNVAPGGTAANYGPNLTNQGFRLIETVAGSSGDSPWTTVFQRGDVVIMESTTAHPSGHAQMHCGQIHNRGSYWISDYKQRNFWPYKETRPGLRIYRNAFTHGPKPPVSPVQANNTHLTPTRIVQYPGQLIRFGQQSERVRIVQEQLNTKGSRLNVNGVFDSLTKAAVVSFQTTRRLSPDGIVGPITWNALFNA